MKSAECIINIGLARDSILQDLARSLLSMLQQALAFVLGFMVRAGLQEDSISVRLGLNEGLKGLFD